MVNVPVRTIVLRAYPVQTIPIQVLDEFVYPKGGPDMTARLPMQPLIMFAPAPATTIEEAIEPEFEVASAPMENEAETEPLPLIEPATAELPQTASPLPLVIFGAVASLVLGLGLGLLNRHVG